MVQPHNSLVPAGQQDDIRWHIKLANRSEFGPLSSSELRDLVNQNIVTPSCLVRAEGTQGWVPLAIGFLDSRPGSIQLANPLSHFPGPASAALAPVSANQNLSDSEPNFQESNRTPPLESELPVAAELAGTPDNPAATNPPPTTRAPRHGRKQDNFIDWDDPNAAGGAFLMGGACFILLIGAVVFVGIYLHRWTAGIPIFVFGQWLVRLAAKVGAELGKMVEKNNAGKSPQ